MCGLHLGFLAVNFSLLSEQFFSGSKSESSSFALQLFFDLESDTDFDDFPGHLFP
jgi:hypothetical protein